MAELISEAKSSDVVFGTHSSPHSCKLEPTEGSAGANSHISKALMTFKGLIYVRYLDHVLYNRSVALAMSPQVREATGWLVYECEQYITLIYDRDAGPPTLKGGDPKASGLVLLRSDIVEFKRLDELLAPQIGFEHNLKAQNALLKNRVGASRQRSEKLSSKNLGAIKID